MTIRAILLCIATCTIARDINTAPSKDNICSSTECHKVASELSMIMDPTVDPCENFYDFVCGSFVNSKPVNINLKYVKSLRKEIYEEVTQLIQADIKPNAPKTFKLVKKLYNSCMNTAAIEAKGLNSLWQHLRDLGGWPVVEGNNWNEEEFNRWRNINKFRRTNNRQYDISDGLGYCAIKYLKTNPTVPYVELELPDDIVLSRKHENAPEEQLSAIIRNYRDTLVDIARKLGADDVRAMSEIDEMISFESKLAEIVLPKLELSKEEKSETTSIAELNEKYPSVPWTEYVGKCVEFSTGFDDKSVIVVQDPDYYVELEALIATTSKRVQANYVMSRIALRCARFSTEKMRKTANRILPERSPPSDKRAQYCAAGVMNLFRQGVAIMYADKYLDKETKAAAKAVVENLKRQANVKLIENDLPGKAAWNLTYDKIAGLVTDVGYPDEVLEHSGLYDNLQFTEDDYFGNVVRLYNYNHELAIKQIAQYSSEIDKWWNLCGPVQSHTASSGFRNSIYIGLVHLRGRYFGKDHPKFMNYGALGRIVGHEMIHIFFERGLVRKQCNKYVPYCGLRATPEFASRAQCLIDQYESYQVDNTGTKLDGTKTLSENLADIGGVKLAYDAYERLAALWPDESKLPGFEQYSAKQMFWISAAATECQKITPTQIRYSIRNYKHTIGKFRVIGMFANMPEFAKDFHCKAISLMNPAKRCDIWQSE